MGAAVAASLQRNAAVLAVAAEPRGRYDKLSSRDDPNTIKCPIIGEMQLLRLAVIAGSIRHF